MGRLRLGAIAAFTLALAGPAGAAEISRVASRGEPGNPFDLHLSVRWDRFQERAEITREGPAIDEDEMRYTRTVNAVVPRIAIGLAQNVELHFEWPYVLADDRSWRFGLFGAAPTGGVPGFPSSIEANAIDANGDACLDTDGDTLPGPCPIFPVAPSTTVYHGGRSGDLKGGVTWGIFDDRKDRTKPFWLVGLDVTFPTAARYDPAIDRGTDWSSPHNVPGNPGPFGEKVWKWDLYTVLSRRMGAIDPYVKAHATLMTKSSSTYSNCEHAAQLNARVVPEMTDEAVIGCADTEAAAEAEARLPWIAGLTVGTELVPYEDPVEEQRVAIDVRLFADYTSESRFYNELTDASGRLHKTEEHLTVGGLLGLYLKASRYVSLHATASLATKTSHFLTGETTGQDDTWITPAEMASNPTLANPNFDWRYDAPGRRFRISEVALFQLSFGGVLHF